MSPCDLQHLATMLIITPPRGDLDHHSYQVTGTSCCTEGGPQCTWHTTDTHRRSACHSNIHANRLWVQCGGTLTSMFLSSPVTAWGKQGSGEGVGPGARAEGQGKDCLVLDLFTGCVKKHAQIFDPGGKPNLPAVPADMQAVRFSGGHQVAAHVLTPDKKMKMHSGGRPLCARMVICIAVTRQSVREQVATSSRGCSH